MQLINELMMEVLQEQVNQSKSILRSYQLQLSELQPQVLERLHPGELSLQLGNCTPSACMCHMHTHTHTHTHTCVEYQFSGMKVVLGRAILLDLFWYFPHILTRGKGNKRTGYMGGCESAGEEVDGRWNSGGGEGRGKRTWTPGS